MERWSWRSGSESYSFRYGFYLGFNVLGEWSGGSGDGFDGVLVFLLGIVVDVLCGVSIFLVLLYIYIFF